VPAPLDEILDEHRNRVNRALAVHLRPPEGAPGRLWDAMRYSVMAGGKRLRPTVVLLATEVCGGDVEASLPAACAVELVHTYSLIHDDLPAMDNDDLRRGRPTCHRAFDEATAILAGDALQALAFEVLAECGMRNAECGMTGADQAQVSAAVVARLVAELAAAIGPSGMVLGQAADLEAERGRRPDAGHPGADVQQQVAFIHRHKTAALFRACARMGGLVAGADGETLAALGLYGEKIGMAFQVVDDILDAVSPSAALGKTAGKDAAAGKLTVPGVIGLEEARAEAARLTDQAVNALGRLGPSAAPLAQLARQLLDRVA
jgi:geranylgeranyl diphosphate synthase type II